MPKVNKALKPTKSFLLSEFTRINNGRVADDKKPFTKKEFTDQYLPKYEILSGNLGEAVIDPMEKLEAPPVCIEIVQGENHFNLCTYGDFTMVIGKAKSKKTFVIVIMLAATIATNIVLGIKGKFHENKKVSLFFDTEQSRYHAQKAVKRICKLAGIDVPDNFSAYGLRKYSPAQRLQLIEFAIYNTPNLGFVVIDGIRDLISSINNEEEATAIVGKLLKWTEELGIHVMCVLHQNKNDVNARGHLGSELTNKAQTVLSVTKDKELSIVEMEYCRDKGAQPFAFTINDGTDENGMPGLGLPVLEENWEIKSEKIKKDFSPNDISEPDHELLLDEIFKRNKKPKYKELHLQVIAALAKQNKKCGETKARLFVQYYQNELLIIRRGKERAPEAYYERWDGTEVGNQTDMEYGKN